MSEEKTPWQLWKEQNVGVDPKVVHEENNKKTVKPWDILNPNTEWDSKKGEERFEICKACPELIKLTKQCKKCGCFMAVKTKMQEATCPIGKW
jgi:hypothetical protein